MILQSDIGCHERKKKKKKKIRKLENVKVQINQKKRKEKKKGNPNVLGNCEIIRASLYIRKKSAPSKRKQKSKSYQELNFDNHSGGKGEI